jgi:hypothetical protein
VKSRPTLTRDGETAHLMKLLVPNVPELTVILNINILPCAKLERQIHLTFLLTNKALKCRKSRDLFGVLSSVLNFCSELFALMSEPAAGHDFGLSNCKVEWSFSTWSIDLRLQL